MLRLARCIVHLLVLASFVGEARSQEPKLDGTYRVVTVGSGRYWHEDGSQDKLVSTRYQSADDFTRFVLEAQKDGTYAIKVKNSKRHLHVDHGGDKLLSTRYQPADEFTRFNLERHPDGTYSITVKGSKRPLTEGPEDRKLSTLDPAKPNLARFILIDADTVPGTKVDVLIANNQSGPVTVHEIDGADKERLVGGINARASVSFTFRVGYRIVVRDNATKKEVLRFVTSHGPNTKLALGTVPDAPKPKVDPKPDVRPPQPPAAAELVVGNDTAGVVELVWVHDGKETVYAVLKPGDNYKQATYEGHRWLLREKATNKVLREVTAKGVQVVHLGGNPKPVDPKPVNPVDPPAGGTYWLGRKTDPNKNVYTFDVPLPADFAAALLCTKPEQAKFRPGVRRYTWEADGKSYAVVENPLSWDNTLIDNGSLAYERNGVSLDAWVRFNTSDPNWPAVSAALKAQARPARSGGSWKNVTPIALRTENNTNPRVVIDFDTDRPYSVARDGASKKPWIVPAVVGEDLYVAWQAWAATSPTNRINVAKVGSAGLARGQLSALRTVNSQGQLVGFAVDESGKDYVLAARAEEFPNNPQGNFLAAVDGAWRPNVMQLFSGGAASDLNSDKFTGKTFYGITNAGSGRLAVGPRHLAATFSRRFYSPGDGLIHQEGNDMLVGRTLADVPLKAGNQVSHSFDQRLIFDGKDFVTLHQGDTYPWPGLTIEKIKTSNGQVSHFPAFTCPTFGNSVYFELGGLAAEPDGYPVLFTATRNTVAATGANERDLNRQAWDLAMVYVVRDFDTRRMPDNKFDVLGSGILANGYAQDQTFTVNGFTWNPATSQYNLPDNKTIKRRTAWLTQNSPTTKATNAKLAKLADGRYVAIWEENTLGTDAWNPWVYSTTRAALVTITGTGATKTITKGKQVELRGVRVDQGDDAVSLSIGGRPTAAWVTAGETNRQLTLHTLDADLALKSYPLRLP